VFFFSKKNMLPFLTLEAAGLGAVWIMGRVVYSLPMGGDSTGDAGGAQLRPPGGAPQPRPQFALLHVRRRYAASWENCLRAWWA